jgi:hypothetical protein
LRRSEQSDKKRRKERVLARFFFRPDQWKTFKTFTFTYTLSRIVRYKCFSIRAKLADAADMKSASYSGGLDTPVHNSYQANFERSKDQKIVAKVMVTCELTIFGLGSHSATGEEWADDDNAATAAEAQSFKRACSGFGLGRYLYYFTGTWVDLDDRKRPETIPKLADWATSEGWCRGLRPYAEGDSKPAERTTAGTDGHGAGHRNGNGASDQGGSLVREIEQMEQALGKRMYRGLLKTLARVWNPKDIQDPAIQQKVLAHMQAAERGFRRLDAALERVKPEALTQILGSLKLQSIDRVDNLQTLREIVLALEAAAQGTTMKQ